MVVKKTTHTRVKKKQPIDFRSLFIKELRNIYDAAGQLVSVFPKIIAGSLSDGLRKVLEQHQKETEEQIHRLERIFSELVEDSHGEDCEAMEGLIEEMQQILEITPNSAVKDSAIVAAQQRIEHYAIACYGTAQTFAKQLTLDNIAKVLHESLEEEVDTDEKLTVVAEGNLFSTGVNKLATKES